MPKPFGVYYLRATYDGHLSRKPSFLYVDHQKQPDEIRKFAAPAFPTR